MANPLLAMNFAIINGQKVPVDDGQEFDLREETDAPEFDLQEVKDDAVKPQEERPVPQALNLFQKAMTPLVDLMPGTREYMAEFEKVHPVLGAIGRNAVDFTLGESSPIGLGLGALGAGESAAANLGFPRAASLLKIPSRAAGAGMMLHGASRLSQDESLGDYAGSLLEMGLGGLAARGPRNRTLNRLDSLIEADKQNLPNPIPINVEPESLQKLQAALGGTRKLNRQQRELYRAERAEKFSKASDVSVGAESDVPKFFGALKGKHTKVEMEPLRAALEQPDIDRLYESIGTSKIGEPNKANAFTGLTKLLDGRVPTNYEVDTLGEVFGRDFMTTLRKSVPMTMRQLITEVGAIPKALKSAGDFGFPFRQGRNLAYRQSWLKSIVPMMKGYGSQRFFDHRMNFIKSKKFFDKAVEAGVAFSDLGTKTHREENAMASFVGDMPLVRNSNRAATLMANELRYNEFERLYGLYDKAYKSGLKIAKNQEEIDAAKMFNPDNPYTARKMADNINVSTGRGKLPGNLEKVAEEANAFMFSPRLMSSRIRSINRILNPFTHVGIQRGQGFMPQLYNKTNSIERKEAVKQLLSIAAAGATEAQLVRAMYKASGIDATIETSPDSSDFMKVKIGDTRYDPFGGYQQYFVPVFKVLMGTAKGTNSGERKELGSSPIVPSKFDVLVDSLANKASPPLGLGIAALKGHEIGGRKLDFTNINPAENTAMRYLSNPIILQDVYEILKEDPSLAPLIVPDMFGQNVDVYDNNQKGDFGELKEIK